MSVHVTARVWKHKTVRGSDLVVLLRLADDADESGFCWPSIAALADDCGIEERQLRRSLRTLEDAGEIAVLTGQGRGHVSAYMVLTGLDVRARAERLTTLEQRAVDLNVMLKARRERGRESPLSGRRKGVTNDRFQDDEKGSRMTALHDKKGSSTTEKRGHVGQIKGDMSIGDFGSTEPDRKLNHHHDPSCDPPPPPPTPTAPDPDAAGAAGGGGGGKQAPSAQPDGPPEPASATTARLAAYGAVTASSYADVPLSVAEAAISQAERKHDARDRAALACRLLDKYRSGTWTPPPDTPPPGSAAPPSPTRVSSREIAEADIPGAERAVWLRRFRAAPPADQPGVIERFRREVLDQRSPP
jgi:hypothetical protein